MDAVIDVQDVTKRFAGRIAVERLRLQIPRGAIFALLGDNGAGKTTTIRMLTGLLAPDSGHAYVLGKDCWRDAVALRHHLGYVPERPRYYDWMTIDELGWFAAGFHHAGFLDRYRQRIQHFELDANKRLQFLSKGQYAKVGLALALAHEPEVLILDEPTSGLDLLVRREFLSHMADLASEGRTIVLCSHQIAEIERISTHAAFLSHGHLLVTGTLTELRERLIKVTIHHAGSLPEIQPVGQVLGREAVNGHVKLSVLDPISEKLADLRHSEGVLGVEQAPMDLEEAYCALLTQKGHFPSRPERVLADELHLPVAPENRP